MPNPAPGTTPDGTARLPRALRTLLVMAALAAAAAGGMMAVTSRPTVAKPGHATAGPAPEDPAPPAPAALSPTDRQRLVGYYQSLAETEAQSRASRGMPRNTLAVSSTKSGAPVMRPTWGQLSQPFHPGHDGIDIATPVGTPVLAVEKGTVVFAGEQNGYGTHVELRHPDGTVTTYSHLSLIRVTVGQAVEPGTQIANSGNTGHSTGPHLHFEVRIGGGFTDPIAWLQARGAW